MLKLKERYKKKYEKYTKVLDQLTWLNACSSGISLATGISSVATFATFIGLPVSIPLGAASLTGAAIASGIILALTKKYQRKLSKVTKLIDIVMPALVVFERVVSGTLRDGKIDEEEFNLLQTFHLKTMNEWTGIDHRLESENRSQFEKRNKSLMVCSLCYFMCYLKMDKTYYQPNHLWKGQKAIKSCENIAKKNLR